MTLVPADGELSYGLDEWPATDRDAITTLLVANGIEHRWEPDVVLVVPAAAEETVDRLLDEVESASTVDGEDDLDAGADGGPEAQAAMSDLFVIADRLGHNPYDVVMAKNLAVNAAVVQASAAPYGVRGSVWNDIQMQTGVLRAAVEGKEDGDVIVARARELRHALRSFV